MNEKTITELKGKIANTFSDLYIGHFHDPLYEICNAYRKWMDNLDFFQEEACRKGYSKNWLCKCSRLDQSEDWNVRLELENGGRVTIKLFTRCGGVLNINIRTDLSRNRIELPSFFGLAGVGSLIHDSVTNGTMLGFICEHFSYDGGKFVKELLDVKKLLEIDYAPLFKTVAEALTDAIDNVNAYADTLHEKQDKDIKVLMKEFGMTEKKPSHYKKVAIKVVEG